MDLVLQEKDVIRTGSSSVCEIGMPDDRGTFRLEDNSELELSQLDKDIRVKVRSGKSFFDIFKPLQKDETMSVESETAVASVRGTQFIVDNGREEGAVSVAKGTVMIRRNVPADMDKDLGDAIETKATAGQEVRYNRKEHAEFLQKLKSLKGNREEMRNFLAKEKMENGKRLHPIRDRKMFDSILKRHNADLDKVKKHRHERKKNRANLRKKRPNIQNIRKQ
jgi:hypothetical protein